jgi:hypothetical protein
VTPNEVEGLFAADLAFLQDLYGIINFGDPADVEVLQRAVLPPEEPALAASVVEAGFDAGDADVEPARPRARAHVEEVSSASER